MKRFRSTSFSILNKCTCSWWKHWVKVASSFPSLSKQTNILFLQIENQLIKNLVFCRIIIQIGCEEDYSSTLSKRTYLYTVLAKWAYTYYRKLIIFHLILAFLWEISKYSFDWSFTLVPWLGRKDVFPLQTSKKRKILYVEVILQCIRCTVCIRLHSQWEKGFFRKWNTSNS